MRIIKGIDSEKSITQKRVCYSKSWMDYFDTVIFTLFFSTGFVICPLLIYAYELDYTNLSPNEKFLSTIILPPVILFGIYMVFRKITELRLRKIVTEFDRDLNQKLVLEFAKHDGFDIRRKSGYCIVLDKTSLMNPMLAKTAVLLVRDKTIYFAMIQDSFKVNIPTMISHFIFEWRMRKWLRRNLSSKLRNGSMK
ncbi:hypothetical protein [Fluviicola sp.]|uniref:hypothetical protein n=1 Tax=Fluviicola sp. TaxID=1917219 RepID=UPI002606910B|nr:hypothetical protein [Fluviicola sp.]